MMMEEKNMVFALILSFLWSGLGLIYAGDKKKGIILAVIAIIFELLMLYKNQIFGMGVFIVWIYSIYSTYQEVKAVNEGLSTA
jgi:hypothetical protein